MTEVMQLLKQKAFSGGHEKLWKLMFEFATMTPRFTRETFEERIPILKKLMHALLNNLYRDEDKDLYKLLKKAWDANPAAIGDVVYLCREEEMSTRFSTVFGGNTNYFQDRGKNCMPKEAKARLVELRKKKTLTNKERRHTNNINNDILLVSSLIEEIHDDLKGSQVFFNQHGLAAEVLLLKKNIEREIKITQQLMADPGLFKTHRFAFQQHGIPGYDPTQCFQDEIDALSEKITRL